MRKTKAKASTARRSARNATSLISADYHATYRPDAFAQKVRAAVRGEDGKTDFTRLARLARENGIDLSRWNHLNVGMQVMNTTNRLRPKLRHGEPVMISGRSVRRL